MALMHVPLVVQAPVTLDTVCRVFSFLRARGWTLGLGFCFSLDLTGLRLICPLGSVLWPPGQAPAPPWGAHSPGATLSQPLSFTPPCSCLVACPAAQVLGYEWLSLA